MGRVFNLPGENITINSQNILASLASAAAGSAGAILQLLRLEVTQSGNTTLAQCRLDIAARDAAGTLTVTSATPAPLTIGGPASGITGGTNGLTAGKSGINASADSGGTYTQTWPVSPNNINGWLWVPTPKEQIIIPPSKIIVARFLAAPSVTTGWTISLVFEELF